MYDKVFYQSTHHNHPNRHHHMLAHVHTDRYIPLPETETFSTFLPPSLPLSPPFNKAPFLLPLPTPRPDLWAPPSLQGLRHFSKASTCVGRKLDSHSEVCLLDDERRTSSSQSDLTLDLVVRSDNMGVVLLGTAGIAWGFVAGLLRAELASSKSVNWRPFLTSSKPWLSSSRRGWEVRKGRPSTSGKGLWKKSIAGWLAS